MTVSDRDSLRRAVMAAEGLRLTPYRDTANKLTVGYGRNLEDVGITREEAEMLLEHDLSTAIRQCERSFGWFSRLDGVRQRVVAEMCFNLGLPRLSGFGRMLAAVTVGHYEAAADEMLQSQWSKQVKGRAHRLAQMMRTGQDV
jgi:lysozyme